MNAEQQNIVKRLYMRSIRRGTKEMDVILGHYAQNVLPQLKADELELYEHLLQENDHDLYAWVTQTAATPVKYQQMLTAIRLNMKQHCQ